jgi:hypothetical protein
MLPKPPKIESESYSPIRQVLPDDLTRFIAKRWAIWSPRIIGPLRKRTRDPIEAMRVAEEIHAQQIIALWRAGVSIRAIVRGQLDYPLMSSEEFRVKLRLAACRHVTEDWRKKRANSQRESDQSAAQWDGT